MVRGSLAATQKPIRACIYAEEISTAAGHQKPSWYVIAENDCILCPYIQRNTAKKLHAGSASIAKE